MKKSSLNFQIYKAESSLHSQWFYFDVQFSSFRSSTATVKETNGRNGDAKDTAPPPKKVLKLNFIYLTLQK